MKNDIKNKNKNENLSSIFHTRFKRLRKIIPNPRAAQLMDYILLGWQNSHYKLKNTQQKWFMKEYKNLIEDTGIPLSTLKRYLKEFKDNGLIETKQALYSRSNESGFEVKKGCYISISPKLLHLLQLENTTNEKPVNTSQHNTLTKPDKSQNINKSQAECIKFNKNELTEELKMSRSYIKEYYLLSNNNINSQNIIHNVNNDSLRANSIIKAIKKVLYKDIKEEISEEVKELVLGTFVNLIVKHKVFLSAPQQVVAEYIFALINYEFFLKNIDCIKHRNNILAKLLKNNSWKTPKGFYKHFYLGENFKAKIKIREERWEKTKENEIQQTSYFINIGHHLNGEKDPGLIEVEGKMKVICETIDSLKEMLPFLSNNDEVIQVKNQIEKLTKDLHQLWDIQKNIEEMIESKNKEILRNLTYMNVA